MYKRKHGSIQKALLPLREVQPNGTACYESQSQVYCQGMEVTGINFGLLAENEQKMIFDGYQTFLANITFPMQLIVRISKLDLHSYLQYFRIDGDGSIKEIWEQVAEDHTKFVQELTQDRMLLERRFYIIIPSDDIKRDRSFLLMKRGKKYRKGEEQTLLQAQQQLDLRYELVASSLVSLGLHVKRLNGEEYVHLIDNCFSQRTVAYPLLRSMMQEIVRNRSQRVEDRLAPASIRVEAGHIVIEEEEHLSILAIRSLPRFLHPGCLEQMVALDETMDIVLTQMPMKQADALHLLRRKQTQYESSRLYAQDKGSAPRMEVSMASRDLDPLLEQVLGGEEQLHEQSLHIVVRSKSKEAVLRNARRIQETLHALGLHRPHTMLFEQAMGWKQCLPGNFKMSDALLLNSSSVACTFPFFSNLVYRPSQISLLEGITSQREPIVSNYWELSNANQFCVAPSGKGKSFKKKIDIIRLFMMYKAKAARERVSGENFQIYVIDPEREYSRLCQKLEGQWIRFSPGSGQHINLFDLPHIHNQRLEAGFDEKENKLTNHIQKLHMLLDMMLAHKSPDNPNASLTIEEKALLDIALYEVYRRVGITSEEETQSRPAPLLRDLYHVLETNEIGEDKTGLGQRLRRYVQGSLSGLFSGQTNVRLDNPFIVFDTKELDDELRPLALMMISNLVWTRSFASLIPRFLIIDELSTLYQYQSGARFIEEMFRRARKQYLSITGITQYPGTFKESSILTNCATHILLGQNSTTIDLVTDMFKLSSREAHLLQSYKQGQGLMLVDGKRMQINFQASALEYQLATTDPQELATWEQTRKAHITEPIHFLTVDEARLLPSPDQY